MPEDTINFQRFKQACEFLQQGSVNRYSVEMMKEIIPTDAGYRSGDVQDAAIKPFFQETFTPLVQELERRCENGIVNGGELYSLFADPILKAGNTMSSIMRADRIAQQANDAVNPKVGNAGNSAPGNSGQPYKSSLSYKPVASQKLFPLEGDALQAIHNYLKVRNKFPDRFSPEEIVELSLEEVRNAKSYNGIEFSSSFEKLAAILEMSSDMISSGQKVPSSVITKIAEAVQEGLNPPEVTRGADRGYQSPAPQRFPGR